MCFGLEDGILVDRLFAGPLGSHFHLFFGLSLAILIGCVVEYVNIINLIIRSSLLVILVPGCA